MNRGKVYLVGAGPGDPDLLTLKALTILQTADVVLHDDLVTAEILSLVRTVRVKSVGKRCGVKKYSQEEIHAELIRLAREGITVARLKGGDPLIFGRAGEEIEALSTAGIEFEIVPGVTAAAGAAATAQIPLTDRRVAPQVMFIAGHRSTGRGDLIPRDLSPQTTLVVHMPASEYAAISHQLRAAGLADSTPCLIVSCATRPDEEICRTTLIELAHASRLAPPAVLIIGNVAAAYTGSNNAFEKAAVVQ